MTRRPAPKPAPFLNDPNIEHDHYARALTEQEIARVRIGDCVKICADFDADDGCGGERFWIEITGKTDVPVTLTGTVANDLLYTEYHGYQRGSVITVGPAKVYDVQFGGPLGGDAAEAALRTIDKE